jgi:hypothetical protein
LPGNLAAIPRVLTTIRSFQSEYAAGISRTVSNVALAIPPIKLTISAGSDHPALAPGRRSYRSIARSSTVPRSARRSDPALRPTSGWQ